MAIKEILLLGNPILRKVCANVKKSAAQDVKELAADLRDTLLDFRERRGFGRGIAAPQIGSTLRVIYIDTDYTGALINPTIIKRSRKKFMLWDDCFSFPDILVKVERHQTITVSFTNEQGKKQILEAVGGLSELLQHEIDHLDGALALDRAIDSKHVILRSEYEKLFQKTPLVL